MVTIITPTYNRAALIPRVYHSLQQQSCKSFEWIVIDDGSSDDTENLLKLWEAEQKIFPIRYFKQINGGKHRALNRGIPLAKYNYILILDSDDYLVPEAVERICSWVKQLEQDEDYQSFAGVSGLKAYENRKVIGQFPRLKNANFIDAHNLERPRHRLKGDKAEVYRKDILLQFPFPEFEGETFISECAVWDKIAIAGYKLRWYGEIICICEYLEDGLTGTADKEIKNFQGFTYVAKQTAHAADVIHRINAIASYWKIAKKKGLSSREVCSLLEINLLFLAFGRLGLPFKELIKRLKK